MDNDDIRGEPAQDAKVLRESGVHKLAIADHDGRCIAYLLAWDRFGYDPDTDTHVCFVDCDGRELMTLYTEGDVKQDPGTNRYTITAPTADTTDPTGAPHELTGDGEASAPRTAT